MEHESPSFQLLLMIILTPVTSCNVTHYTCTFELNIEICVFYCLFFFRDKTDKLMVVLIAVPVMLRTRQYLNSF